MPTYPVIQPLKHDGAAYAPGDAVEMDAKAARELLLLGVLGKPSALAKAAPAPKAEAKPPKAADEDKAAGNAPVAANPSGPGEGEGQ